MSTSTNSSSVFTYTSETPQDAMCKMFPKMSETSLRKMMAFQRAWEVVSEEVQFNEDWNNGTGYLDHAVEGDIAIKVIGSEDERIKDVASVVVGQYVKGVTDNGRRFIISGTRLGAIVMFERYALSREKEMYRICFNEADKFHEAGFYICNNMGEAEVVMFANDFGPTYSKIISNIMNLANK